MIDYYLLIASLANLIISTVFLGIATALSGRAQQSGVAIWVDLGKSLVYVGICMLAQGAMSVLASVTDPGKAKLLWFIVFIMFAVAALIIARYSYRTHKMLKTLLGDD